MSTKGPRWGPGPAPDPAEVRARRAKAKADYVAKCDEAAGEEGSESSENAVAKTRVAIKDPRDCFVKTGSQRAESIKRLITQKKRPQTVDNIGDRDQATIDSSLSLGNQVCGSYLFAGPLACSEWVNG